MISTFQIALSKNHRNISKRKDGQPMKGYRAVACGILALVLMWMLSGCSVIGLDSKALMSPPREAGDRGEIHDLLISKNGNVTFRYPQKGDYRSAIIMKDLTGDREDDAIALYESEDGSGSTVSFISRQDGEWSIIRSFTNAAIQVDRVCFADLDDDGSIEVIVGWGSSTTNSSTACVYDYSAGGVLEIPMEQGYGEMAVTNLVDDVQDELFVATLSGDSSSAVAQLIRLKNGSLQIVEAVTLDPTVVQYSKVSEGLISTNQQGILLDGIRADSTMVTQMIYWNSEKEQLKAPYSDDASQKMNITSRSPAAAYTSRDMDGNSILEFPIVNLLPGNTEGTTDPAAYLVNWCQFDLSSKAPLRVMSTVINSNDGFWFLFPDSWRGTVTCKSDLTDHSTTFYECLDIDGTLTIGSGLLKIQVFNEEEWAQSGKDFVQIGERGGLIYGAMIMDSYNQLAPSIEEVQESFNYWYPE